MSLPPLLFCFNFFCLRLFLVQLFYVGVVVAYLLGIGEAIFVR